MARVRSFVVRFKRRRFELVAAIAVPLVVGLWGIAIVARLDAAAPRSCVTASGLDEAATAGPCLGPMRAWWGLMTAEGDKFMAAMALLPFIVGLLAAGPIVARECEERTAQTAWWLYPSRRRWLIAELGMLLAVVPGVTLAAVAASPLAELRVAAGLPGASDVGLNGPLVLVRTFAGLGIGLLAGALVRRVLPGILFAALVSWALVFGVGWARDQWVATLPPVVLAEGERGEVTAWEWRSPDGEALSDAEAMGLVPEAVARLDAGQPQAVHSMEWLAGRGFRLVAVGVPEGTLYGWALYEGVLFGLAGFVAFGVSFAIVERIRPR
ncbi:MAG TPA: hypothetical protein VNO86_12030 [Candidatus Binatia bacterium]|nr:hypothetical protein [Candidatus Binatia bacterium]